jgi:hypothetical protein
MNCKEAYVWLLGSQTPDDPPVGLQQHLLRCAQCRQRQKRLLALESELRQLPRPGESPQARQRFLEKLPAQVAVLPPPPEPITPALSPQGSGNGALARWVISTLTAAALVIFALGLTLGWSLSGPDSPIARSTGKTGPVVAGSSGPRESAVARILDSDLRLADTSSPQERVTALADMASELRGEALRLAKEGHVEDVLLVSGLYERVVFQGVVNRAKAVPAEQQSGLVSSLVKQLEQTADESNRAAATALPGADEGLRNLAAAARAASRSLSGETPAAPEVRSPAWQFGRSGTMRDLMGTLVLQGLDLAKEDDPLKRADYCNDMAEHLVQGILLASSGGDSGRAETLGGFLGSVMDRGVGKNLDRGVPEGAGELRLAQAERIGQRLGQAVQVLEDNLEKAPPAAQPALQKAIEKASHGHDKFKGKGKAKGKKDKFGKP